MGRVEDVPEKAVSEVRATTSQISSGSTVPQEKLKLAFKLLGVSSRVSRVLVSLDQVVDTNPFVLYFFGRRCWSREVASPGQFRTKCSERAREEALVREGCPS